MSIFLFVHVGARSLAEACLEGDVSAVRKLLEEGWSVHEPTDEGESLLSLACSAGRKHNFFILLTRFERQYTQFEKCNIIVILIKLFFGFY